MSLNNILINNNSKYSYKLHEGTPAIFVFEVLLEKFNKKNKIIRKIKKINLGNLISSDENIKYNHIYKINLIIIDINDNNNEININLKLDQKNKYTTYINNNICLEFISKNNKLECNYKILI